MAIKKRSKARLKIRYKAYSRRISHFVNLILFLLIPILSAILCYQIFGQSDIFKIKTIEIVGTQRFVNGADLKKLLEERLLEQNILFFEFNETLDLVTNTFLGIKNVEIKKDVPDKVVVHVTERQPLAVLTGKNPDQHFLVDDEGYVLGYSDEEYADLPLINYEQDLYVGMFIDKNLAPLYLELLTALETQKLSASSISVNETFLDFYLKDNVFVLIGRDKDVKNSVSIIAVLLKQLAIEGKTVKKIDLRYDKVIVEY